MSSGAGMQTQAFRLLTATSTSLYCLLVKGICQGWHKRHQEVYSTYARRFSKADLLNPRIHISRNCTLLLFNICGSKMTTMATKRCSYIYQKAMPFFMALERQYGALHSFSNFSKYETHLQGLLKCRLLGPTCTKFMI